MLEKEMPQHNVKILYGPTASGKSSKALELAEAGNGIVINADAMQCYKALPCLTAQPTMEEQGEIPHKLYDFAEATEDITVIEWQDLALTEIDNALNAGQTPFLVGGTGFYIKALIEGLSPIPDIPEETRQEAVHIFEADGLAPLLKDLDDYDADSAQKIDRDNSRRVIRAWEVLKTTGQSLQEWQSAPKEKPPEHLSFEIIPVTRPREELIKRINTRFDQMLNNGILDEVKALSERIDIGEVPETALIIKAHGFRPLRAYLKGEKTLEDAVEQSKAETRQYAKRQMTWMRHQFGILD